jgi:hypothetical protein
VKGILADIAHSAFWALFWVIIALLALAALWAVIHVGPYHVAVSQ